MKKIILALFVFTLSSSLLAQKPNIIYIMADDHSSQAWGIYGGILAPYVKNDNIKRLQQRGVTMNNVYCTNSICVPSRAAILSGRYSHRNAVYTLADSFSPDSNNVAKELKNVGYSTAIVGKWHLKKEPAGFDYYMVLPGQGRYQNPYLKTKDNWRDGDAGGKEYKGYSTDVITEESIKWLENRDKTKPFFLCTHFKATHEPFDYPERYNTYLEDVIIPEPENLFHPDREEAGRVHDGWPLAILAQRYQKIPERYAGKPLDVTGLNEKQIIQKTYQKFIKSYLRAGAAIDDNLGKLLDYLDKNGLAENTIVIYTSDQGYFLGEHNYFDKRFFYEPSAKMPMLISYPKAIKAGSENKDLLTNVDFAPTLMDFAGAKPNPEMQGKSFKANLTENKKPLKRKSVYYRYWENEPKRPAHFGIRTDRYKLIFFYGQKRNAIAAEKMDYPPGWELYDLKHDPNENHNVYADKKYQKTVKKLKTELLKQKTALGDSDAEHPAIQQVINGYYWN